MSRRNVLLLAAALLLVVAPLCVRQGQFGSTDRQAQATVQELRPGYEPWFSPVWRPPSGEVESLLFALQAALGAGLLGYYFGLSRGRAGPGQREAKAARRSPDDACR